jgi:hypothetical protein
MVFRFFETVPSRGDTAARVGAHKTHSARETTRLLTNPSLRILARLLFPVVSIVATSIPQPGKRGERNDIQPSLLCYGNEISGVA